MARYSIELRRSKYIKGKGFLPFARNIFDWYGKKLLNTATKTRLDAARTASKKLVHKTAEKTVELKGNKITKPIGKPKRVPEVNSTNAQETVTLKWNKYYIIIK